MKWPGLPGAWTSIANVEAIATVVELNPTFHDAEIRSIVLDRDGSSFRLELEFPCGGNTRSEAQSNRSGIALHFANIEELVLRDFNHQNVVAALYITRVTAPGIYSAEPRPRLRVEVESVFGTAFSFFCESGAVVLPTVRPASHPH